MVARTRKVRARQLLIKRLHLNKECHRYRTSKQKGRSGIVRDDLFCNALKITRTICRLSFPAFRPAFPLWFWQAFS